MVTPSNPERIGRYQVLERVGRGGMGVLFRAIDPTLDREVAIKLMMVDLSEDSEQLRPRFYREARAAAKLQHPNIVTVFEFAEEDATPYIVMEFLRGTSLAARMAMPVPLTLDHKLAIVTQLCEALHYAHQQGVVHRDVKPGNIFILADGSAKLLDFGIAKMTSSSLTRTGDVLGSASYMSPEQVAGSESVDGRSDVFSAGVVLYELLAGRKPFHGDVPTATILKILNEDPPPLEKIAPDLPPQLIAAVRRALAKDPQARFPSAGELARELRLIRRVVQASSDSGADLEETRFATPAEMLELRQVAEAAASVAPTLMSTQPLAVSAAASAAPAAGAPAAVLPAPPAAAAAAAKPASAAAPPKAAAGRSGAMIWGGIAAGVVAAAALAIFLMRPSTAPAPDMASTDTPAASPAPDEATGALPDTAGATPDAAQPAAGAAAPGGAVALTMRQMPPGTVVAVDGTVVQTVGADGAVAFAGVRPGRRTLRFTRPGFEPVTLTRDVVAGRGLTIPATDVAWRAATVDMEILADAATSVTISQGQETVQRLTGPSKVSLAAGSYEVVAQGPSGIPLTQTVDVSAEGSHTIDLRNLPAGMDGFGAGWTRKDTWFTRRGGGFVLYDRPAASARVGFTVRTDRSRNPFSTGPRLKWVVNYVDPRNHALVELASDYLYKTEIVNGARRELPRVAYKTPAGDLLNISVDVSPTRIVHQYNAGAGWAVLDSWDITVPDGARFGFFLPATETLELTNFRYDPGTGR